jgi:hypothetical protein
LPRTSDLRLESHQVGNQIPLEDCQYNRGSLFSALPASIRDVELTNARNGSMSAFRIEFGSS